MKPFYHFSDEENKELTRFFQQIVVNPYTDYQAFKLAVAEVCYFRGVPGFFVDICTAIKNERESGVSDIHVLRNCPRDIDLPELDPENPISDKYKKKKTFIGEVLLECFSLLTDTPLLAYGSRNNGDFFTDVIAIRKYSGQLTGFSDSELVYHNDRTAHAVRADFVTLLGLRSPDEELIFTGYIDGKAILAHLTDDQQAALRQPWYRTQFDVYSRETNRRQVSSPDHAILKNHHSIRYLDTLTHVAPEAPNEAKDALIAFMQAMTKADKQRHRILQGDLLTFANQDGLHNREKIEIKDKENAARRWLLKTYAFRDRQTAEKYQEHWHNGIFGRVED
ncbi:TauD/TfdA family dioxygenase [Enterobacter cloacae]|uniref:TauD/TfdA family dioxygenase n=1 Tax=Enterobacter TaxID=547 RepID=UPI000D1D1B2D|nr:MULTISPECIES: TauD/TfdA family dioxygenase [Enterobacter]MBJ6387311.1 TauD/TfdA family dioxygenase [Enterobacter cloacae]MBJ6404670.1 TauD/TfdA family dioxygenase [Enterobacter cloacae]MBJ6431865.1 TauD/TfdA family dioxygenase [Enterobacter cloacae]MBJ6456329.1 TauD/TfdA family dioxygenase [Enterobacter cloacae]MBJ6487638.1 TauD/TfdA family dioxygenase [Enterobacter cloacae]